MLPFFAAAPGLFTWPLGLAALFACFQIAVFLVGAHGHGGLIADATDGTHLGDLFDWLNLGRVPFSVILMLLLASFGTSGLALTAALPGFPLWATAGIALVASLGVTKLLGSAVAKVIPSDETYAVTRDSLVGRIGRVTLGPLDDGHPGTVRVRDQHEELHTLRARPADAGTVIEQGAEVVVVSLTDPSARTCLVMPLAASPAEIRISRT